MHSKKLSNNNKRGTDRALLQNNHILLTDKHPKTKNMNLSVKDTVGTKFWTKLHNFQSNLHSIIV